MFDLCAAFTHQALSCMSLLEVTRVVSEGRAEPQAADSSPLNGPGYAARLTLAAA